jgi:hypothetical protein
MVERNNIPNELAVQLDKNSDPSKELSWLFDLACLWVDAPHIEQVQAMALRCVEKIMETEDWVKIDQAKLELKKLNLKISGLDVKWEEKKHKTIRRSGERNYKFMDSANDDNYKKSA